MAKKGFTGGYQKRWTADDVRKALQENPNGIMLESLRKQIDCSEMTLRNLIKPMIESGDVIKKNIGASETRPIYIYCLKESSCSNSS